MKRLFLMRHGQSPGMAEAKVPRDALRPLSDKGRRDAARMARELAKRGGKPTLVLHSPLVRAEQTAKIVAAELKVAKVESFAALDNTLPADELLAALVERGAGSGDALAVGHNPQLGELSALIAKVLVEIRPAGLVALELKPAERLLWWSNIDELD